MEESWEAAPAERLRAWRDNRQAVGFGVSLVVTYTLIAIASELYLALAPLGLTIISVLGALIVVGIVEIRREYLALKERAFMNALHDFFLGEGDGVAASVRHDSAFRWSGSVLLTSLGIVIGALTSGLAFLAASWVLRFALLVGASGFLIAAFSILHRANARLHFAIKVSKKGNEKPIKRRR